MDDLTEKAGWLMLDLADYLRMCQNRSATVIDKQERKNLTSRIVRQLRLQERAGDPLAIVEKIRDLMANPDKKPGAS